MKLEDIKTGYHLASQGKRKVCVYVGPDKWVSGEEDFFERAEDMLEDGWTFARLVPAEASTVLLEALEQVISSAHPNETEHPKMWAAWQSAKSAIDRAKRIAEGLE